MTTFPLRLPAPAKINLYLRITGVTSEGYHLLDTAFAYAEPFDTLILQPTDALEVTCSDAALNGRDNLVYRVLDALRRKGKIRDGLRVHIEKRIPSQAGLGGGSSDAASALLAANRLWGLNMNRDELIAFAAPFGADIPCFLFGGSSIAGGIGDKLTPLDLASIPALADAHLALAHPGAGLATADVFRRFDLDSDSPELTPPEAKATIRADRTPGATGADVALGENMLEAAARAMSPQLSALLSGMRRMQPGSWMSGSGSACVALCDTAGAATRLARKLTANGLAAWSHAGRLLNAHPLAGSEMALREWGVAKR